MTIGSLWLFTFVALYWACCIYWAVDSTYRTGTVSGYFVAVRSVPWWMFMLTFRLQFAVCRSWRCPVHFRTWRGSSRRWVMDLGYDPWFSHVLNGPHNVSRHECALNVLLELPRFVPYQVWASAGALGIVLLFFSTVIGLGAHFLGATPAATEAVGSAAKLLPDLSSGAAKQLSGLYIRSLTEHSPWFLGLLALCGIAGVQAMVGIHIAAAGSMFSQDVYGRYFDLAASDATRKHAARIAIFFVIIIALLVATCSTELLAQSGALALSYGARLTPPLAALCWFSWITREGAVTGLGGGLAATFTDNFGISLLGFAGLDMHADCESAWGHDASRHTNWIMFLGRMGLIFGAQ